MKDYLAASYIQIEKSFSSCGLTKESDIVAKALKLLEEE